MGEAICGAPDFADAHPGYELKYDRSAKNLALKPNFDYPICFFAAQRLR
jgi:hypothetical protein